MVSKSRPWVDLYDEGVAPDTSLPSMTVLDSFLESAMNVPDRVALRYKGSSMTMRKVDDLSSRLAAAFSEHFGVCAGDRVGVQLQNVPQFVLTVVATWKLKAILVPINPMLRERELAHILSDASVKAFVTTEELGREFAADVARANGVKYVVTTQDNELVGSAMVSPAADEKQADGGSSWSFPQLISYSGPLSETLRGRPALEMPALLTYTSGTTGVPKAAINTHRNIAANVQGLSEWFRLGPDDVIVAGAPLFHITGFVVQLCVGMALPAPLLLSGRFDPKLIAADIETGRATFSVMAITAYIAILNDAEARERDLSSLTKAATGGAPVPPSTVEAFEDHFGVYLHNAYGLTESTSATHSVPLGKRAPIDATSGALSIGAPIANTDATIVDEDGTALPTGTVGHLLIRGPQVMDGYWNRPSDSRDSLRGGWLHTGDAAFMDTNGWFYLVDRYKEVIIASGYKVWPREVEDVLYEHPSVREAAVVGVDDDYRGETVEAYVSLKRGTTTTPDELVAFCKARLAAYKYPRRVHVMEDLPKTATGKILRRAFR